MTLIRHLSIWIVALLASAPACSQDAHIVPGISLPDGFRIELFADNLDDARSLALGAEGTVFVSTRQDGRVYALVQNGTAAPRRVVIAEDLQMPNGIAYFEGDLYVAELTRIIRFRDIERSPGTTEEPELVYDGLPAERHHGWRFIDFGPDGRLYVSIGAPCNVCDRPDFGLIGSMNPDGSDWRVVARGVRNSVGFDWHPQTGKLWFTDNGRDMLGDNRPQDELNRVDRDEQHFGFPYCHAGDIPDPEFGSLGRCADATAPAQKLGPHVAPLGIQFYTGTMFPDRYRNRIFIAEHGSWNRTKKIGYRITVVRLNGIRPDAYEPFATGWLHGDEQVSGRPVDLLQMADGSVLVSDDQEGRLYRISYREPVAEIR